MLKLREVFFSILLFGSVGAIAWAVRGSNGWGGIDGTIVPGMAWGLLWYYVCARKRIDARGVGLWLGLGISIGGELGYGQYTGWILGKFSVGDEIIHVAPWIGYAWFIICGIGWGSTGAIALGWTLSEKRSVLIWGIRIIVPAAVGYIGWRLVQVCPWLIFPNHHLGIYDGELDHHLERTVYTNTQNFVVLCWWLGALLVAAIQKDRTTLVIGLLIGGGFGLGFMQGAIWCLGYGSATHYIDWWKMWELNAGFNLGALYVLALYWWLRRLRTGEATLDNTPTPRREWFRNATLTLTYFFLYYVLFQGASSWGGVVLELYDPKAVGQYEWPTERIILFAPFAIIVIGWTLFRFRQFGRAALRGEGWKPDPNRLSNQMTDLATLIGLVGVITACPAKTDLTTTAAAVAKIGVLYAFFVFLALFALNRLNRELEIKPS